MFTQFDDAWAQSDRIFDLVDRSAWTDKGIVLRHPLLFYVGHLPAFAYNQWRWTWDEPPMDPVLDDLFARGIDPEDEVAAASLAPASWPPIDEVVDYRDRIRGVLRERGPGDGEKAGTLVGLTLEHELMHHETLLYLIAQLPVAVLTAPEGWDDAEPGEGRDAEPIRIPGGTVVLGQSAGPCPLAGTTSFPPRRSKCLRSPSTMFP